MSRGPDLTDGAGHGRCQFCLNRRVHGGTGVDNDVEAMLAEAATKALYETETASGWYGQPECAEVGRIVAKALLASPALATVTNGGHK